jgi:hypothetical protein
MALEVEFALWVAKRDTTRTPHSNLGVDVATVIFMASTECRSKFVQRVGRQVHGHIVKSILPFVTMVLTMPTTRLVQPIAQPGVAEAKQAERRNVRNLLAPHGCCRFSDKVAVITGSTTGIGLGIAERLGQEGCAGLLGWLCNLPSQR